MNNFYKAINEAMKSVNENIFLPASPEEIEDRIKTIINPSLSGFIKKLIAKVGDKPIVIDLDDLMEESDFLYNDASQEDQAEAAEKILKLIVPELNKNNIKIKIARCEEDPYEGIWPIIIASKTNFSDEEANNVLRNAFIEWANTKNLDMEGNFVGETDFESKKVVTADMIVNYWMEKMTIS